MWGTMVTVLPGGTVSEETTLDLLDLLCYYNSQDPPECASPEQRMEGGSIQEADGQQSKGWGLVHPHPHPLLHTHTHTHTCHTSYLTYILIKILIPWPK